jgi:integrase
VSIRKVQKVRGTRYEVHYRDLVGHQVKKTLRTRREAEAFEAQVKVNRPDNIVAGRVSLADVFEEMGRTTSWTASTIREHDTQRRNLERVDPQLFTLDVGKLSLPRMATAIAALPTADMRLRHRVFLNQLLKQAGRPTIPNPQTRTRAERMARTKRRERPLETAEVEAILGAIDPRYQTIITVMAYVGLRPGEAYGLQLQDFDQARNTLTIRRAISRGTVGPTKTGETRMLPIGGLGDLLRGHIDQYGITQPGAFLFTNAAGRSIHESTFLPLFKRAAKAAGIPNNVSPNSLRHHAAAWMIRQGANVLQVSRMLGHARPSITLDVYAYLFTDSLDAVAAILPGPSPQALPAKPGESSRGGYFPYSPRISPSMISL